MHENSQMIALLLSIVLIYVFDTTFDRGLKVRLLFATMPPSCDSDSGVGSHMGMLSSCEYDAYVPQTMMLEGRTNLSERVFGALFNDSYPKSSTLTLEKGSEHAF